MDPTLCLQLHESPVSKKKTNREGHGNLLQILGQVSHGSSHVGFSYVHKVSKRESLTNEQNKDIFYFPLLKKLLTRMKPNMIHLTFHHM